MRRWRHNGLSSTAARCSLRTYSRLIVERVNAGDAEGAAALYEADAVLDFPMGHQTVGRAAIQEAYKQLIAKNVPFGREDRPDPCRSGDLALTSTRPTRHSRRSRPGGPATTDGSWLRVLSRPESGGRLTKRPRPPNPSPRR